MTKPKIFIFPGNGDSHIDTVNWYASVRDELKARGYEVFAEDMPDSMLASARVWLPYITTVIDSDENVVLIGHSSGSVAIMRYLETHKVLGAILTGVNYTDLGFVEEKLAGYYNDPWQWTKIKANAKWIVQFAATDDPYISLDESHFIQTQLNPEYYELSGRGHFETKKFEEIIKVIDNKLR